MGNIRQIRIIISLIIIGLFVGCAGVSQDQYRDFRVSAGESNKTVIPEKLQRIIDTYLYEIVRFEESPVSMMWETGWRTRAPFADEMAQGITEAQTRLIFTGRPKSGGGGSGSIFRVHLTAQNMVRIGYAGEWIRVPNTKQYSAYIREIAYSLKTELDMSQRVFD